jgi:putative oxidoreductase
MSMRNAVDTKAKGIGLLFLRLIGGALVAGHGAQKLFGWFEGPGLEGTRNFVENLGIKPGTVWGPLAGLAEFGGGTLTALGFLNPLGPLGVIAAMTTATFTAHKGKPIWAGKGGAELPLTNIAIAVAVALEGPGRYSLDHTLGIRLPRWLTTLAVLATATGLLAALRPDLIKVGQPEQT